MPNSISLGDCRFELLVEGECYLGVGRIWLGPTLVRSGRLPLRPYAQTFQGLELTGLTLASVEESRDAIRINLQADFRPLPVKLLRDHSFDPIHDLGDWDQIRIAGVSDIAIVLRHASRAFNGHRFGGFSYHYEYESREIPIFHLLDKSSWELDGDITGATVYNQSACSNPLVTFAPDTSWSTEGSFYFSGQTPNPVMTHNLPRWASHQAYDFQFKGDATMIGVFERVDLIRTTIIREPNKPELKTFDKHIFDETRTYSTSPKQIMINTARGKSAVDQQNLWTWILDDVHARARDEFGLREQPPVPLMGHHYWVNQTIATYERDVGPAARSIGSVGIFLENFKKSDRTEGGNTSPPNNGGNMCCSHDYELAPAMGSVDEMRAFVDGCRRAGVETYIWTNTYVSRHAAALNSREHHDAGWFCHMEDTRLKYAGAYTDVTANLNLKNPEARRYWVSAHRKLKEQTGIDGCFIDSFYNLFFMALDYRSGHPQTMWREALLAMKELQDAGVGFYIESFGPFGHPAHGHPSSYNDPAAAFICYLVGRGNDCTTIPIPGREPAAGPPAADPMGLYFSLAHKAATMPGLFVDGKRLDEVFNAEHRRMLAEYRRVLPLMHTRYLQEDGLGVLWHDDTRTTATLWNFTDRRMVLPGIVTDCAAADTVLSSSCTYDVRAGKTYRIQSTRLPTQIASISI